MGLLELKYAKKQQKAAQEFTKTMMQKAHQWEVADLRAAGLNPILSATGGSPQIGGSPALGVGGDAVGSMLEGFKTSARMKNELAILRNEKERSFHAAGKEGKEAALSEEKVLTQRALTEQARATARIEKARVPGAEAEGRLDAQTIGEWTRYLNRIMRGVTGGKN